MRQSLAFFLVRGILYWEGGTCDRAEALVGGTRHGLQLAEECLHPIGFIVESALSLHSLGLLLFLRAFFLEVFLLSDPRVLIKIGFFRLDLLGSGFGWRQARFRFDFLLRLIHFFIYRGFYLRGLLFVLENAFIGDAVAGGIDIELILSGIFSVE